MKPQFCTHPQDYALLREGYYGYECPTWGALVFPYGCAPWEEDSEPVVWAETAQ